jgi:hypothetical protein
MPHTCCGVAAPAAATFDAQIAAARKSGVTVWAPEDF